MRTYVECIAHTVELYCVVYITTTKVKKKGRSEIIIYILVLHTALLPLGYTIAVFIFGT